VKRLGCIALLVATAGIWPLTCLAQQRALPVVGFLNSASADGYAGMAEAFRHGLKETGYVEGQNVTIEYRWANNVYDRLPALAADPVSRRAAVIVANSPAIAAAEAATKTIPITFMSGDDPVRLGFVASLAKPGGNATGVTIFSGGLAAKRLAILLGVVPQAKKIAVLINSDWPAAVRFQADVEAAAQVLGLPIHVLKANDESEINDAFDTLVRTSADALLVGPGPFFDSRRDKLVALAAKIAIPAGYESRTTAAAGGLASYGASVQDGYRQVGVYAGRVLNGEKPADLPVLQPTKFEYVINLRTAKTLGISVPAGPLSLADEVIE
jgi:putative ABC transport system substrate-binding protein